MIAFKNHGKLIVAITVLFLVIWHSSGYGAVTIPVQPQDLVDVSVDVNVQFDTISGLYTYHYQVANLSTSSQEVAKFGIEVDGEVTNIQSPQGWLATLFDDEPTLMWGAFEVPEESLPPDFVDDGNIFPSPFQIKPGETLGGFSYQSPEPPQATRFFAQGFAKLPTADDADDFDTVGIAIPVFPENSKKGSSLGPGLDDNLIFFGGRRPSVDGFLGFVGSENRETRSLPVAIIIRFAINGESVDTTTFNATLNNVDVTESFLLTGNGDERLGTFALGNSPIVTGRNVLKTSVKGIVPDTTRTATDADTFTFFVVE